MKKISIIMTVYNTEKYLKEAIESILNQTYSDFEFIIVDDGSTDKSKEIIKQFEKEDKRIIFLENKENIGVPASRNKAIKIAKGEFIAIMDSDDISLPERFEKQINFFTENKDYSICGTNIFLLNDGKEQKKTYFKDHKEIIKNIFKRNPFCNSSVMIKKSVFLENGFYNENLEVCEDLDLRVSSGLKYKMYNLSDFLVKYRIHNEMETLKKQKLIIKTTLALRRKAKKLGYKMNLDDKIFYIGTWFMQFFPAKFVLFIFNKIFK